VTRLVLATRNPHKVEELRRIVRAAGLGRLAPVGLDAFGELPDVAETGRTFVDNALLKARAAVAATGEPCVADDSGLCVDVLGGMPGVFSARWSGRHGDDRANLELLLAQLSDIGAPWRGAAFVAAVALVTPAGREVVQEGRVEGTLATEARGEGGFGYDPVFVPLGETRTTAELPPTEKDNLSHRGVALRRLAPSIAALLG
jgi:XTP/dITP diphosphohydrolase